MAGLIHGVNEAELEISDSETAAPHGGGKISVGCRRLHCQYLHAPLLGVEGAENTLSSLCAEVGECWRGVRRSVSGRVGAHVGVCAPCQQLIAPRTD
jgi:hypothetical protein